MDESWLETLPMGKEHELSQLQTLYSASDMLKQVVAQGLDINVVLPRVLRVALDALQGFAGSIILVDDSGEMEHGWVYFEEGEDRSDDPFLKDVVADGLFAWALQNHQTAVVRDTTHDDRWLQRAHEPAAGEAKSVICTPLIIRTRPVGAITITRLGVDKFDQRDVDLLEAVANQTASTVESARLYQQSERRANFLTALVSATAALTDSLDVDRVLQGVAQQLVTLASVDACAIFVWDRERDQLIPTSLHTTGEVPLDVNEPASFEPRDYPILELALETMAPQQIQVDETRSELPEHAAMIRLSVETGLVFPIIAIDTPIGVAILMDTESRRTFEQEELDLIQMLANQAGIAIRNASLYQDSQRQLKIAALLNNASRVINSTLDTNQILQSLLAQMNELLNAETISIALVDPAQNELVFEVAEGVGSEKILGLRLPSSQGVSGWVMEHGEAALVHDMQNDPRFYREADESTGRETRSMLCAPLLVRGQVLGTIQAVNPREGAFTESDKQLLVNLGNLAGSALANAQQFARIRTLERMREDLMAMLVHDLQSPLGNIISSLELMRYELPNPPSPTISSIVDIATRSSRRLQTLIRSLLDISLLEAGHPVPSRTKVNIGDVISEAEEIVGPGLNRRHVTLDINVPSDTPRTYIDRDMIRRVFVNLLDNAGKHTPEGDQVVVEVEDNKRDNQVCISVSDSGPGVPPQYRDVIFEKFLRLQETDQPRGMGLGLAFCRLAVEAHGGRIWVDEAAGGGARFNFTLPKVEPQQQTNGAP